jgi:lipid-A-disaccharide synthase-like uncharacterized protein
LTLAPSGWLLVGLLAQTAFSARFLVQWVLSERARRSFLPAHFWLFSVAGSSLLLSYAAHQRDIVIVLGQMIGLAIYLRNIELLQRKARRRMPLFLWPWLALAGAAMAVGLIGHDAPVLKTATERAEPIWFGIGLIGQALFTGRFLVQWYVSERVRASTNPVQFWYLSLSGSLLLLAYALHTGDPVIVLGQSFGLVVYVRNLALIRRHRAPDTHGVEFETGADALGGANRRNATE